MSDAEVITILIYFHLQGYRCLKHFYIYHLQKAYLERLPTHIILLPICRVVSKGCYNNDIITQNDDER